MRLLVLSSWWPSPPANGSKLRAWHLLRELARRHEITLCSFAEPGEAGPADVDALRRWCRDVQIVPGNPHKPRTGLSWRGYFGAMPRSYAQTFTPAMADYVTRASQGADALIALQIGTALYLNGTNGQQRLPRIFEEAEASVIRDQPAERRRLTSAWRQRLTWRKYAAFTRQLIATASRTTVVSERERRCLAEAGCDPSRIAVLPNGVAGDYLDMHVPKQADTLIYAGSPTYAPNLDAVRWFVTEILPRVRAVRPTVRLVVTGRHDGIPIASLGQGDGVIFTGQVADVAAHVAGSAVSIAPLRRGGGTRLKILEAMALGTPVVSTTKGAEGLQVRHGAELLIADTPEAFARSILDLLEQPARALAIATQARRCIAEHYTWQRIGLRLEEILQEAVDVERAALRS
jgi:glycosyltransferase involved in cell wall biosynthesis